MTQRPQPAKLKLIVGSTRPTRASEVVTAWVEDRLLQRTDFELEKLDLREWQLPFFQEHAGTLGDFTDPPYSVPIVKEWNRKLAEADAILVVSPEYQHSIPGVLKNAFDSVFASFALRNKPIGAVSYSSGAVGGARAVEHLAAIIVEADAAPMRNSVLIPYVLEAFDGDGHPKNPVSDIALTVLLEDLDWWSRALSRARADGELAPGVMRFGHAVMSLEVDEPAAGD